MTVLLLGLASMAPAADHRNLDSGVPLTIEDAYTVKFREPAIHGVFAWRRLSGRVNLLEAAPEIEYGFARDWQLNLGTRLWNRSRGTNQGSGNVGLGLMHNFNAESLRLPAVALKAQVELPTGAGASASALTLKGILTKTLGFHRLHLNASHTASRTREPDERRHRWQGVAGWDRPLGLQSLLIADLVVRQPEKRPGNAVVDFELGLRRQMTPRMVISFGAGWGLSTRRNRDPFFFSVALTQSI